jgi:hypothetical protein
MLNTMADVADIPADGERHWYYILATAAKSKAGFVPSGKLKCAYPKPEEDSGLFF